MVHKAKQTRKSVGAAGGRLTAGTNTGRPPAAPTLAARVREAAQIKGVFTVHDLGDALGVQKKKDLKPIRNTVLDFLKRGEVVRLCRGTYEFRGRIAPRTYMDKIWHLVRSHRHFDTSDIERLSGAARATVTEYLRCLEECGYLRRSGRSRWRLVNDPGPRTPVNTGKCKRLKELRLASGRKHKEQS